jgi:hypothetical protein
LILGGDGSTALDASGSSADNVLVASARKSRLTGGAGRDILIGSPQSSFQAGRGDDLVIKGITPFNNDVGALNALMAEWSSAGSKDATRIDHLLHGGRLNGTIILSNAVIAKFGRNTLLATALELAKPAPTGPKGALPAPATMPSFSWSAVTGADHYRIRVDDLTTGMRDVPIILNVAGTTWFPPAPLVQGHRYRWWVQGFDNLGNGSLKSAALSFRIAALAKPKLAWPQGANAGVMPTFWWAAVVGADHYQIVVENVTTGRPALVATSANVPDTNWMPSVVLSAGERYRWRVRALGPTGSTGSWSDWSALTV